MVNLHQDRTLRMAYADPPYVGQSKRHYVDHEDYAGEVDHEALIARLVDEYPDGWALSASSPSLRYLLPLCPEDVRVAAWVKPFGVFHCNPAYVWEPVIFWRGRGKRTKDELTVRDWVSVMPGAFRGEKHKTGVHGTKPREVCFWVFGLLGLRPGDDFHDLFPGSGAVMRAWREWCAMPPEDRWEQATLEVAA